jgi:hypothetical protein
MCECLRTKFHAAKNMIVKQGLNHRTLHDGVAALTIEIQVDENLVE